MKLRIYKEIDERFYVQKRIFKFLLIEWWIKYPKGLCCFSTVDEAKARIEEIKQQEWNRKHCSKNGKEILRYTV